VSSPVPRPIVRNSGPFLSDLFHLDGEAIGARPLKERNERLRELLSYANAPLNSAIIRWGAAGPSMSMPVG
jgi:ATP-dependent DNA ligase